MAASKTAIANMALTLLGSPRVANIEPPDATKGARLMGFYYDQTRQECLRETDWNFAAKEASLTKDGTDPLWVFENRFLLLPDTLAVREINSTVKWEVIGRYIYTNADAPLEIKYTYDNETTNEFDPLFTKYFAHKLALAGVEELTQSGTKQDRLRDRIKNDIEELAWWADGAEGSPDDLPEDDWIIARQ